MVSQDSLPGKLIVFEGIDGSGLTTHAERLQRWMNRSGTKKACLTKEPTSGPIGALIRLKLTGRIDLDEATLALMFAADRLDHLNNLIIPRLSSGINVICDRYYLSSLAYQSLSLDTDWIKSINRMARRPDLTILLDVPAHICWERIARERWHVELYETETTLDKVRANYHRFVQELRAAGENIVVIKGYTQSGSRPIREIELEVQEAVRSVIDCPLSVTT